VKTSFGYEFKTTPRQHQAEDLERGWLKPAWARFHEMRTGKGVLTVYEMDALAQEGLASRFLIVCPKRVISTWMEMIHTHARTRFAVVRTPSRAHPFEPAGHPGIVLLNYDMVWARQDRRLTASSVLVDWQPEYIVADEAHKIKNRTSNRAKALHVLGRMAKFRRALTGTPDPTSWADYWSIYKFLDPSVFGTWTQFVGQYLVLDWWRNVVGYRNTDDLAKKVHSMASVIKRADCGDVPAEEDRAVSVPLHAAAKKVYTDLARRMRHELEENRTASAAIVLTKLLRLAQVTGGFVRLDDGTDQWLHMGKIDALLDILEEVLADAGARVVVYCRFRGEIERVSAAIRTSPTLRGVEVLELHGDSGDDAPIRQRFEHDPRARVLVSQIATGSLGLDLSVAETAVFYSWDFDAATYRQARDRIWKSKGKVTRIHLVVPDSIDTTMLKVVQGKMERSALLLDRWNDLVQGRVM